MDQAQIGQAMLLLVLAGFTIEAVWQTLKMTWDKQHLVGDRVGALLIGVFFSVVANLDFYTLAGYTLRWPIVGVILTGILLSRGANFMHDLLAFKVGLAGGTKNDVIPDNLLNKNLYTEPLTCPFTPELPVNDRQGPQKIPGDDGKATD